MLFPPNFNTEANLIVTTHKLQLLGLQVVQTFTLELSPLVKCAEFTTIKMQKCILI
jgi:hypothetical protein